MRTPTLDTRQWRSLLRTGAGWTALAGGLFQYAWPLVYPFGLLRRRILPPKAPIVAVVGSFGKSTTVASIRRALGIPAARTEGRNSYSFLAAQVFASRADQIATVLEVGIDEAGQMRRYARLLRPRIVVVTSIGSEHNRSLGTLEETRHEKAMMVRALDSHGVAVLNWDDPHVRWMSGQTSARTLRFGQDEGSDLRVESSDLNWPAGRILNLLVFGRRIRLRTRLLGRHQVSSILAAIAVALDLGVGVDAIVERLEGLEPLEGRLQPLLLAEHTYLIRDDFKSSLETVETALDLLGEIPARRRIIVLGDISEPPGSQGPIYRRIGRKTAECADLCYFYGNFQRYAAGARESGQAAKIVRTKDLDDLIRALRAEIRTGDLVLVKGRDTQRLDRVSLALSGRPVKCRLTACRIKAFRCSRCPLL